VKIPGARRINIYQNMFSRGPDGFIAVSGSAYQDDNTASAFVGLISPDGLNQNIIRTSPMLPIRSQLILTARSGQAAGKLLTVGLSRGTMTSFAGLILTEMSSARLFRSQRYLLLTDFILQVERISSLRRTELAGTRAAPEDI
jgi:hypothetical protein